MKKFIHSYLKQECGNVLESLIINVVNSKKSWAINLEDFEILIAYYKKFLKPLW